LEYLAFVTHIVNRKLTNVIDWVLKQQTHVEELLNTNNIKFKQ